MSLRNEGSDSEEMVVGRKSRSIELLSHSHRLSQQWKMILRRFADLLECHGLQFRPV